MIVIQLNFIEIFETRMKLQRNENAWIKMGRLYRRVPMLKHIPPLLIPIGIFSAFIAAIFNQGFRIQQENDLTI